MNLCSCSLYTLNRPCLWGHAPVTCSVFRVLKCWPLVMLHLNELGLDSVLFWALTAASPVYCGSLCWLWQIHVRVLQQLKTADLAFAGVHPMIQRHTVSNCVRHPLLFPGNFWEQNDSPTVEGFSLPRILGSVSCCCVIKYYCMHDEAAACCCCCC